MDIMASVSDSESTRFGKVRPVCTRLGTAHPGLLLVRDEDDSSSDSKVQASTPSTSAGSPIADKRFSMEQCSDSPASRTESTKRNVSPVGVKEISIPEATPEHANKINDALQNLGFEYVVIICQHFMLTALEVAGVAFALYMICPTVWSYYMDRPAIENREPQFDWKLPDGVETNQHLHANIDFSVADILPAFLSNILYPFEWENLFDATWSFDFTYSYNFLAFVVSIIYIVGVFYGQHAMKNREPFDLRGVVTYWNLFLAIFSFIGACRTVPHLIFSWRHFGLDYLVCRSSDVAYQSGASGVWLHLFVYSKYFELFDTVLLVLRKKPVIFLHWYHHATVLMFTVDALAHRQTSPQFFVAMNYSVHAVMYFYYYLASIGQRPWWAQWITTFQTLQMVGGMSVTAYHYHKLQTCETCNGSMDNIMLASVMYLSYFLLFVNFFIKRFVSKQHNKPKPPAHKPNIPATFRQHSGKQGECQTTNPTL